MSRNRNNLFRGFRVRVRVGVGVRVRVVLMVMVRVRVRVSYLRDSFSVLLTSHGRIHTS